MTSPREDTKPTASLRERAEAAFQEMAGRSPDQALSPEATGQLLHELRVHQIELELQNEELRRTQEELGISRARYFDLYDLAPVGYVTLGAPGVILQSNLTAANLLGVARGALVKQPISRYISKDDQVTFFLFRKHLLEIGEPRACDLRIVRPDGATLWTHWEGSASKDASGEPELRLVLSDITERMQAVTGLLQSESRMRAITDSAQDAILIMDPEGRITYWNPAAERIFGYTGAEAMGRNLHELLVPPRYLPAHQAAFPAFLRTGQGAAVGKTLELEALHKDGREISIALSLSAVSLDGAWHAVGILRDITERKRAQEALQTANEQLRRSIQRAEELAEEAQCASQAKGDFLAVMSHELRTPLNGVLGFAELLSYTQLDNEQESYAQRISASGNHLLAVVNDILDFSSIEKGRLAVHAAPIAVAELVESFVPAVRKAAEDKGLAFRCETSPGVPDRITGDARRISQILLNLLGNAVKFTSEGSVVLRVAPASADGRPALDFSVEDTGIGISGEVFDHLFQPFAQADTTMRRPFEGTGLGLAISRRLADAMGGTISIVSTPGRGSTFTLRLPLEASASPAAPMETGVPPVLTGGRCAVSAHLFPPSEIGDGTAAIPPATPGPHTGGTPLPPGCSRPLPVSKTGPNPPAGNEPMLVVEDDPENSLLAGKMLESLGVRAEFAAHGAEAVAAFAPGKFSAILMDMRMPVMDGLQATRKIRESGSQVPIIALTANVMPGDRERCLAAGMDDVLSKPFTRAQLAAKLARVGKPLPLWNPEEPTP